MRQFPAAITMLTLTAAGLLVTGCGEQPATSGEVESAAVHITSMEQFEAEVLQSDIPAAVDFYADWCPPCRKLSPVLAELANDWEGRVKVVKINVDENRKIAMQYEVSSIPDVRFFKDGKQVGNAVGFHDKGFWEKEFRRIHKM